jgi:type VI secretion system protein ImpJ
MAGDQLARVNWRLGQTLLPEHFFVQEQSLLTDSALRFGMVGLPFYGIGRLSWNESLLAEGILTILELQVILPTGELLDIPKNATAPPFNMNLTGMTTVSVYFHLMGEKVASNALSVPGGQNGTTVQRKVYEVAINADESMNAAIQTFGLADFHKHAEGTFSLSADYVPALIQSGTSPFLMTLLDQIDKQVESFHFKLVQQIAATHLSGDNLQRSREILRGVYRLQSFLKNLKTQIKYHPYYVFEALKDFYIELCFYQNTSPEHAAEAYLHHDIAVCINKVAQPILTMLKQVRAESPYTPFEQKDGMFVVSQLPERILNASQVFLLIQKDRVGDRFDIELLKLASINRLSIVHHLSLVGVPIERIERPPFQHSFGPEVEFYQILGGEEWDYTLRDMSLAFYEQPEYKGLKAYIYWREG